MKTDVLFIVSLLTSVSACEKSPSVVDQPQRWEINSMNDEIGRLKQRVESLEGIDTGYKIGDDGFGFVETQIGGATLQWTGIRPSGNGVELSLKIGNPSTAVWNRFTIIGRYGKLNAGGSEVENSQRPFMVVAKTKVPAGSWRTVPIRIDGPSEKDVGVLHVTSILIENIGLASSQSASGAPQPAMTPGVNED